MTTRLQRRAAAFTPLLACSRQRPTRRKNGGGNLTFKTSRTPLAKSQPITLSVRSHLKRANKFGEVKNRDISVAMEMVRPNDIICKCWSY